MTLNQSFRRAALKLAAAPMPLSDLPHLSQFANPARRESMWTGIGSKLPRPAPAATVAGKATGVLTGPPASAASSGIRTVAGNLMGHVPAAGKLVGAPAHKNSATSVSGRLSSGLFML